LIKNPNLLPNPRVTLTRSGIITKPTDKLLVSYSAHILCAIAASEPWKNRADFGVILISIGLEVDADGVVPE
jgi:hypothetical protein